MYMKLTRMSIRLLHKFISHHLRNLTRRCNHHLSKELQASNHTHYMKLTRQFNIYFQMNLVRFKHKFHNPRIQSIVQISTKKKENIGIIWKVVKQNLICLLTLFLKRLKFRSSSTTLKGTTLWMEVTHLIQSHYLIFSKKSQKLSNQLLKEILSSTIRKIILMINKVLNKLIITWQIWTKTFHNLQMTLWMKEWLWKKTLI